MSADQDARDTVRIDTIDDTDGDAVDGHGNESSVESSTWTVDADEHAQRLDKVLAWRIPAFSRSHLQALIELGHARLDGRTVDVASRKLRFGQVVSVDLVPTAQSQAFQAEPMTLPIVYEDDDLLVVDKPAGLVVHPAAGHWSGTLMNGLLAHHAGAFGLPRAGLVHRLDKDTSGLMVVAKTLETMTALVRALAARELQREYLALAHGRSARQRFTIDAPIGRDPVSRVRMAVRADGKPARTDVECIASLGGETGAIGVIGAWRCKLHTGRTHQIRVHLAAQGLPLVADGLYGGAPALGLERQALHAVRLAFTHPRHGAPLDFQAPLPPDLAQAWLEVAPGYNSRCR